MTEKALTGRPFTTETARAAAHRSAELRRERMLERQRYADTLDGLIEIFGGRDRLGLLAFAATAKVIEAAARGNIPEPETALDRLRLVEVARNCHAIGRLEAGESTSNTMTATVTAGEIQARLDRLRGGTQ